MNDYDRVLKARAILLDWDGCVMEGGKFKPGARQFLRAFGHKTSILSNNSTSKAAALAGLLRRAGVDLPPARIHLAGQTTLELAAETYPQASIWVLGDPGMLVFARSLKLHSRDGADDTVVILMRDTRFSFSKLDKAVNLLRAGARLVVSNPDITHPRGDEVAPETGALLAAIGAIVDLDSIPVETIGKPSPTLFTRALQRVHVPVGEALMIGDNPTTDIEGARRLGIGSLLLSDGGVTLGTLMTQGGFGPEEVRARA